MDWTRIRQFHIHNVASFWKSPLAEISGSLGDLGTLLPLMIALAVNNSISLSTTLVFSGLWNILTGVAFGIPLPVQPMKVWWTPSYSITWSNIGYRQSQPLLLQGSSQWRRPFPQVSQLLVLCLFSVLQECSDGSPALSQLLL